MTEDLNETPIKQSRWAKLIKLGVAAYLGMFFVFMFAVVLALILGFRYFNQRINSLAQNNSASSAQPPVVDVTVPQDAVTLGHSDAPVTIIEFADFQCPFCKRFHDEVLPTLKDKYLNNGQAKLIFQDFAFLGPESLDAAAAAKCANDQGQFWAYHDLLYQKQGQENGGTFAIANLKNFAQQLGLEPNAFNQCLDSGKYKDAVAAETAAGQSFGVAATPTFFVNGKKYEGVASVAVYEQVIDQALSDAKSGH